FEGSSKGIAGGAVHDKLPSARAAARALLAKYPDGVLVEAYVAGDDVVAPWLEGVGTDGALAIAGYKTPDEPDRRGIYDYDLKNTRSEQVEVVLPAPLSRRTATAIHQATLRLVAALGLRDLCRLDFRVDADGTPWFIEINALPSLEPGASIYLGAALEGLTDEAAVLNHLVKRASARRVPVNDGEAVRVGLVYNLRRVQAQLDGAADHDAEFDAQSTIDAIAAAIAADGHVVVPIEADSRFLRRMGEARVDLVFNMAEGLRGRGREGLVPAVLDMLEVPHTGSDAVTLGVTLDKALAKRLVRDAGLPTAPFAVVDGPDFEWPPHLTLPGVVKPLAEGSSKGVTPASVVRTEAEARAAIAALCSRYSQSVLIEAFLPGREFTIGMLAGPAGPEVLPALEVVFVGDEPLPIYHFAHKLGADGVRFEVPAKVDAALQAELDAVAVGAWHALGCRDVARVDLRLDAEGRVCFIECNPLPGLAPSYSDLCVAAEAAGIDHGTLVRRILAPALARWRALRRAERAAE
ncbi:MAG: D-alanine--D-alanine ligase, partial [Myxococcales bacterium]|nr:D-alanine--D-alanine ligase [Myxococcales bacterium]